VGPPRREILVHVRAPVIDIKVRWHLTATTPERDALGQMLETCS